MPELAKVFAKHTWVENKKFLLVPYQHDRCPGMEWWSWAATLTT